MSEQQQRRLTDAITAGDVDTVRAALSSDPELAAARDGSGVSLLMLAQYHRQAAVVEELVRVRPHLDLFEAAALGNRERAAALLQTGPDGIGSVSADGFTPLHLAAFFGHPEVVATLLAAGAEVDPVAANPSRVTPLHSAAAGRNLAAVEMLLAAGADPNRQQTGGFTALHAARMNGDERMEKVLLEAGADPKVPMPEVAE